MKRSGQWYLVLAQNTARQEPAQAPAGAKNASAPGGTVGDEAAIRKIVADGTDAWNRRDAKSMLAHLAEDSDHINVAGSWDSGRDRIEKGMTDFFATHRPASLTRPIEKIRFITPEIAVLVIRNKYANDKKAWEAISISVFHKVNREWWNKAFQNTLVQSQEVATAQAARTSGPMAQTEPEVIMPADSKIDFSGDVAAIRKIVAENTEAWNRRDAKAQIAHFSEDIDHIGVQGLWRSSRAEIEKGFTAGLPTVRNDTSTSVERIRFLTADVAAVIVRREYTNDKETRKSISTSVFHKIDGTWWIEAFQNTYVVPPESRAEVDARAASARDDEIQRVENEWVQTSLHNDGAGMDRILADEFTSIRTDGPVRTKTERMNAFSSGNVQTDVLEISDMPDPMVWGYRVSYRPRDTQRYCRRQSSRFTVPLHARLDTSGWQVAMRPHAIDNDRVPGRSFEMSAVVRQLGLVGALLGSSSNDYN